MKSKFIFGLLFTLLILSVSSCAERVDAGYEGIKVNLYGDDKGVDKITLVTGMVWYNPLTTAIYEYPTFVQTVDYPPFSVNAKDGSSFVVDPTISLKIVDGKSAEVFKKYRKVNITEVINTTLYNYVRNAFRIQLNAYTTDELVSKREEFEKAIEDKLSKELLEENFQLEQLTSGLQYPKVLIEAINSKNEAVQKSQKAENELAIVKAEAQKKVISAQAEYEANILRTKALTPQILQQMWIEKWNGTVPTVTSNGNSGVFLDISKISK